MRRALLVALAIHLGILLIGGYIYVLPPGEREKIFRAILHSQKIMPMKKVRTAPKKRLKKAPTVRPIRRTKSIELIGVRRGVASEFTVPLPEISRAVYTPQIALVSIPEPTMDKGLGDFWETQLKLRETAVRLESFGVSTLKPLGSVGNPVAQIIFQIIDVNYEGTIQISMVYPEQCKLSGAFTDVGGLGSAEAPIEIGPYPVPPEDFIFSVSASRHGSFLSTDTKHFRKMMRSPATIEYNFDTTDAHVASWLDLYFRITFIGGQGR